jgi:hypothetical protein
MPGYPELKIRGMFDQLVESSGDQELAESYRDHRAWILREDLPERLKDFPNIPLREFDWTVYPEKELAMLFPWDYQHLVMTEYFGSLLWTDRVKIVEFAPILLTPAIEPYLDAQLEWFTEQGMDKQVQIIEEHRGVLIRAREVGYLTAVQEHLKVQSLIPKDPFSRLIIDVLHRIRWESDGEENDTSVD